MFAGAGISASSRFSAKSSSHSGRSHKRFPAAPLRHFPGAPSLFREFAGEAMSKEELVLELDDSPGTTKRTKFPVLHMIFLPVFMWLLTTDSLIHISVLFAELI